MTVIRRGQRLEKQEHTELRVRKRGSAIKSTSDLGASPVDGRDDRVQGAIAVPANFAKEAVRWHGFLLLF